MHTVLFIYFECANIEKYNVQALIQQNNSILIRGIIFFYILSLLFNNLKLIPH